MKRYKEAGTCRECVWSDDNPPRCEYNYPDIEYLETLDCVRCSSSKFLRKDSCMWKNKNK